MSHRKTVYRHKSSGARVGSRGELNLHTARSKGGGAGGNPWAGIPKVWRGFTMQVSADYDRITRGVLKQILKDEKRSMRPSEEVAPGVRKRRKSRRK